MVTDVHAKIRDFLQGHSVAVLPGATPPSPGHTYNKAGVVPFIRGRQWRFLMMKPVARHAHLEPPALQLCKGTRMQKLGAGWKDLRDGMAPAGELEPLPVTALREGIEELGLRLDALTQLADLGPYGFSSAISADPKQMWLYAAEMTDEHALLPEREVALTTHARQWMTLEEFEQEGRADHRGILRNIAQRLAQHLKA